MRSFTQKVYAAISNIPFGQVRSYKWVAKKAGKPKAYRAVGQILKNNPYTVIIPCHRVVASDGSLGGFSQGLKKKRDLLRYEESLLNSKLLPKLLKRGINK
jgi:methylated-DNA-[protein]-cysteine S-methyltransferase